MGQALTLAEIVRSLPRLDPELTIYASEPWTGDSAAVVDYEPDEGGLPESARQAGLAYFLEVDVASEVADDWKDYMEGGASDLDLCNRLISYAVNDA